MSVKQILIFDSGVGGLSVFSEIIKQVPHVNGYYLSDNAYFPYGELSDQQLIRRLSHLLGDFVKKHPVDLIVIACNSASTVALNALRDIFTIPVVGVVPAIKPASMVTRNHIIGLLATPATIQRAYTTQLINEFAAGKQVLKIGSTALVKLAEEKLQGRAVDKALIREVFKPWLMLKEKPDTIVLGCTHFPLLKAEISECMGEQVLLVDSGRAIASRVAQLLPRGALPSAAHYHAFYTKNDAAVQRLALPFKQFGFATFSLFN